MNRRHLIGGIAVSLLATTGARAAQRPPAKVDTLYPYLKLYLEAPPEQRSHFSLAYYVMRDRKPAPDVKAWLVGADGRRRAIAIGPDGRIGTLPSLADLRAGVQVEIDAPSSDKITARPEILADVPPAAHIDIRPVVLAMQQANAAIASHAGILSFAVPKLTCAYLPGAHSGQAVLASGRAVALPLRSGPVLAGTPYFDSAQNPDARSLVLDRAPSRVLLGGHPRN